LYFQLFIVQGRNMSMVPMSVYFQSANFAFNFFSFHHSTPY